MADSDIKKTISINPELFKVSNDKGRKREKKERKSRPTQRANPLKKELMNKIKSHASKHNKTLKSQNRFEDHMEYLASLSQKKKLKVHSELPSELAKTPAVMNTTKVSINNERQISVHPLHAPPGPASLAPGPTALGLTTPGPTALAALGPATLAALGPGSATLAEPGPTTLAPGPTAPGSATLAAPGPTTLATLATPAPAAPFNGGRANITINPPKEPPYGILKRGNKPTFRQWHKMTQKVRPSISKPSELVQQVRKTYSLGKNKKKNKVSIFLKNKKTRKKIQDEMSSLKKIPIEQVKEYLRKHNMIKAGSNAPHDVLRQLYLTSHLAGEINNKSDETLIHNYLAEDTEDNK